MGSIKRILTLTPWRSQPRFPAVFGFLSMVFLIPLALGIPAAAASGDGVATISPLIASDSISVSSSGNVSFNIVRTASGTMGVGKDSVKVSSNSPNGYQLYISGNNVDTTTEGNGYTSLYLNGAYSSANKLTSIPSLSPTAFTSYVNHWGYAVGGGSGFSSESAYQAAVDSTSSTGNAGEANINNLTWKGMNDSYQLIRTSSTNTPSNESTDVYYGIYVDTSTIAGIYQNTITYTAFTEGNARVAIDEPVVADGDTMRLTVEFQSTAFAPSASDITVRLYDSANTSLNIGTCTNVAVVDGTGSVSPLQLDCTYSKGADAANDTPYSVEVSINVSGGSLTYTGSNIWQLYLPLLMQDTSAQQACLNATVGDSFTMVDSRTDYAYTIKKLADGNCWMVQNLSLKGKGGTSIETANGSSYSLPSAVTACGSTNPTCFVDGTTTRTSTTATDDVVSTNTGSYFSWDVATAGTGGAYGTDKAATDSVCPKGWSLPTGNTSGQFNTLYTSYSSNYANLTTVWSQALVGYYYNSGLYDSGSDAYWWSSTQNYSSSAYYMYAGSSSFYPTSNDSKRSGNSVRCVLTPPPSMQDSDAQQACLNSATGTEFTMVDNRTNYAYKVKKLADGNCWMVQNLSLKGKGGTSIETAKGNSYTLPAASADSSACGSSNPTCFVEGTTTRTSTTATDDAISTNTGSAFSWDVATAGSGGSYGNNIDDSTSAIVDAPDSVCPKGWSLPTDGKGSTGQPSVVYSAYGSYSAFTAVWSQAFLGYYDGGLVNSGSNASWWTSSQFDENRALPTYTNGSSFRFTVKYPKYYGIAVRCVLARSMQNQGNIQTCLNSAIGTEFTMLDDRTKYAYTIKKLADGNCWMTQNLSLKGKGGTSIETASGGTYTLPSSGTSGFTSSTDTSGFNEGTTTRTPTSATDDVVSTNTGSYFTWYVATAGTGGAYGTIKAATDSVCPKGWSLPTGGSSGQFNTLYTNSAYNSYDNFTAVWSQALVGVYGDGSLNSSGSHAAWWSSTQRNSNSAYSMLANSSSFYPTNYNNKYAGYSVRCVAASST